MSFARRHPQLACLLLLAIAAAATYHNIFQGSLIFDDTAVILTNRYIRDWHRIPAFFASTKSTDAGDLDGAYRPLLLATYAVNYALDGLQLRGYRLGNLLLHLLNAGLLLALLRRYLGHLNIAGSLWIAGCAALLFFLHPLQTHDVNYIWKRSDLLVGAALLGCLLAALPPDTPTAAGRWRWPLFLSCAAAAFCSKESAVILPGLLGLLWLWARARHIPWPGFRPFFLVALLASSAYLLWFFHQRQAFSGDLRSAAFYFPAENRLFFAKSLLALQRYLTVLILPQRQTIDYLFQAPSTFFSLPLLAGLSILLLLLAATLHGLARGGWAGLAGGWFLLCLAPSTSFINHPNPYDESRLYLASAALAVLLAAALQHLRARLPRGRSLAAALALLLALAYGINTWARNATWQSEEALWRDAIAKDPRNGRAHLFLASYLEDQGRLPEALGYFRLVRRQIPTEQWAWVREGVVAGKLGDAAGAQAALLQAARLTGPVRHLAFFHLGVLNWQQRRKSEAKEAFRQAMHFPHGRGWGAYGLMVAALAEGDIAQARQWAPWVLQEKRIDPNFTAQASRLLAAARPAAPGSAGQ